MCIVNLKRDFTTWDTWVDQEKAAHGRLHVSDIDTKHAAALVCNQHGHTGRNGAEALQHFLEM